MQCGLCSWVYSIVVFQAPADTAKARLIEMNYRYCLDMGVEGSVEVEQQPEKQVQTVSEVSTPLYQPPDKLKKTTASFSTSLSTAVNLPEPSVKRGVDQKERRVPIHRVGIF